MKKTLQRAWRGYGMQLERHPMRTKMASGMSIYLFGDTTMQWLEGRKTWDYRRTGRMCVYGGLWLSPFLHGWYGMLDKVFVGSSVGVLAGKLLVDQTIAATANMCMFFTITSVLQGDSLREVKERLDEKLWPTMKTLWCIWPAVQVVNFTLVPLEKRVLVVNCVGVAWSIYLSYMGNN
mmetsp:Transcript_6186/g.9724  ORF Transcript_6186/g.9724 Transcript_6186/m.9724 type:complete len:178 (+) Transcript_6186:156-689(+)